jgi:hypothetical protein
MHPFENPGSAKCYRAECRRTPLQETCKQHALRPGRGTLSDWRGFHAFSGRRIELCDLAKAIGLGIVRSGDKRSAHFRTVPAGYDAKPKRLFCRNVTRRKVLHGGYTFKLAFSFYRAQPQRGFRPNNPLSFPWRAGKVRKYGCDKVVMTGAGRSPRGVQIQEVTCPGGCLLPGSGRFANRPATTLLLCMGSPCALSLRLAIAFSREIGRVMSNSLRLALYSGLS